MTFEDLKLSIRDRKLQEKIFAIEAVDIDVDAWVLLEYLKNEYAQGNSMPIVFNEQWASKEDFERHCNKSYIVEFFQKHCIDKDGLVKEYNVSDVLHSCCM